MPRKRRQPKKPQQSDSLEQGVVTQLESVDESPLTSAQWTTLRKRILNDQEKQPLGDVFGDAARGGTIYRWGLATAIQASCDVETQWLSRMAVGASTNGKRFRGIQPLAMVQRFQDTLIRNPTELIDVWAALVWSAAMPSLLHSIDEGDWWNLLGTIQEFRDGILQSDPTQPSVLIGATEIGLTLSYGLRALPSCRRLAGSSVDVFKKWCEQDDLSISAVLSNPLECRLAIASLLRLRRLLGVVETGKQSKKKDRKSAFERAIDEIGIELTTWVAALTRHGGVQAFSNLTECDLQDDLGKNGLLTHAAELDRDSLQPAIEAALGRSRTKGRLAWQISLPEAMLHDEQAHVACMLPEWDVRRGRTVVEYGGREARIELTTGKSVLISGRCETSIAINGHGIDPCGDWVSTCEYTDDDVHYLEMEQAHEGGYVLQRQVMIVREDRCFFFADAVIKSKFQRDAPNADGNPSDDSELPSIDYQIRFPLADQIRVDPEQHTTDLFIGDHRRRALLLPLSSGEWKNSPSTTRLQPTEDRHLLLTSRGQGQLYVPLWIDLSRDRFSMKRTWRQLTVGEQMKLIPPRTAAAFRIQVGKTQWILYRSMAPSAPRTFLGKHMIADFYAARFDAKEETYEDLITVEDNPR